MQYNECMQCGANNGRAGNLYSNERLGIKMYCRNCWDTKRGNALVIHADLPRTEDEYRKQAELLQAGEAPPPF